MDAQSPYLGLIFVICIFYILPVLLLIIFPAWVVPNIVKTVVNRKNKVLPSIIPFVLCMIILALFANTFWEFALYNKVYYEWDRTFIPYSFFSYETASFGGPNWLADGWNQWHLYSIWLGLTVFIYVFSAIFSFFIHRRHENKKTYGKILAASVIFLSLATIVLPQFLLRGIGFLFTPKNLQYKEVQKECSPTLSSDKRILYRGDQQEWISDFSGENLRQAFNKLLQLNNTRDSVSPNGAMAAIFWNKELWFHCLNSDGAYKVTLPNVDKDVGEYSATSFPSWSPDSSQMVMNNRGDLTIIDVKSKTTNVIRPQVALRDNHVNVTAKDRDMMIPPFERGEAVWSASGMIYYTAFVGDTVFLHALNPTSNEDTIIYQAENPISINLSSPDGRWLLIYEQSWATKRDKNNPYSKRFFFDTQSRQIKDFPYTDRVVNNPVWSPSGQYVALSTSTYRISDIPQGFPATITQVESGRILDITNSARIALEKLNVDMDKRGVVVEIIDFDTDTTLLITVRLPHKGMNVPRQINGILDITTNELRILQDYPDNSFNEFKGGRLSPLQVIE